MSKRLKLGRDFDAWGIKDTKNGHIWSLPVWHTKAKVEKLARIWEQNNRRKYVVVRVKFVEV